MKIQELLDRLTGRAGLRTKLDWALLTLDEKETEVAQLRAYCRKLEDDVDWLSDAQDSLDVVRTDLVTVDTIDKVPVRPDGLHVERRLILTLSREQLRLVLCLSGTRFTRDVARAMAQAWARRLEDMMCRQFASGRLGALPKGELSPPEVTRRHAVP